MRVTKEKAAENRERILNEASRLFLQQGVRGVGVDALAESAGLTYGSLYSQFGSKERLLAEALERAFANFAAKSGDLDNLEDYIERYLSLEHRDHPGEGCVVAALGSEMFRQGPEIREVFGTALTRRMNRLASLMPHRRRRKRENDALAVMATMAGAMILARAVDDPKTSERILSACRDWLRDALNDGERNASK